ncbi:aminotransferase class I/II-fold pyridoxal phosphate-dependent enzyme [Streptomyces sp. Ac-502]|uniref:aminotransferase class I/II-fold pyridoxal phosphate-dependent enzyme n=1 Tax=Streptomyces sp. Ac-502 TaxID=3342801 RepID=UPI0038625225
MKEQRHDVPPYPHGPSEQSQDSEGKLFDLLQQRVTSRRIGGGEHPQLWDRSADVVDGLAIEYPGEPTQTIMTTYDYLGLLGHPAINESAKAAIDVYGTGGHGSPAAAASLTLHRRLEQRLAAFTGQEAAILFPSGFQANATLLAALTGKGDQIFSDELNHASIITGCKVAAAQGAQVHTVRHNDAGHLSELLADAPADCLKVVVCDSVFSADGDLLDLPAFEETCQAHQAVLYLDEAHGIGILGPHGKGIHDHYGRPRPATSLVMGTLSKTLPASGGFLAAPRALTEALHTSALGHVFSGSLTASAAGAALAALDVLEAEGEDRRARLRYNVRYFVDGARRKGLIGREEGPYESAIVPLLTGDDHRAMHIAEHCRRNGVMVVPFVWPIAARGNARLRVNLTARHTTTDIDRSLDVLETAFRANPQGPWQTERDR